MPPSLAPDVDISLVALNHRVLCRVLFSRQGCFWVDFGLRLIVCYLPLFCRVLPRSCVVRVYLWQ